MTIEHWVSWADERGKRRGSLHVRADGGIEIETADERYGTTLDPDSARDVAEAVFTALRGPACPLCGSPPAEGSPGPPGAPPELRYTAMFYIRGESEIAVVSVVVPVEPCGRGLWRHWTREGWRIVNDGMVWKTQEQAVEAELSRIEEERARKDGRLGADGKPPG